MKEVTGQCWQHAQELNCQSVGEAHGHRQACRETDRGTHTVEWSSNEKKAAEKLNAKTQVQRRAKGGEVNRRREGPRTHLTAERGRMMARIWRERQAGKQRVSDSTEHYTRAKRLWNGLSLMRRRRHARAVEGRGGELTSALSDARRDSGVLVYKVNERARGQERFDIAATEVQNKKAKVPPQRGERNTAGER